jgi:hypothetical protein
MAFQFPGYFQRTPVVGQNPFAELRWNVYNRTGTDTVLGGVYQFDTSFTQAETTNFNWQDAASCWRNVMLTGALTSGGSGTHVTPALYTGYYCVATKIAADNTELEVVVCSPDVSVLTVAASAAQYLPRWSGLLPIAAQHYAGIYVGNTLTARQIGRTNVATDLGSTTVGALRSCMFTGIHLP